MIHADEIKHLSSTGSEGVGEIHNSCALLRAQELETELHNIRKKQRDGWQLTPSEEFFVRHYPANSGRI